MTTDGLGSFLVHYGPTSPFNPNQIVLSEFELAAGLLGDYNQDGFVNAADYTVWRNNLGSLTSLPNDSSSGVGPDDYERRKSHFGESAGSGSGATGSAGAVLEPSGIVILLGTLVFGQFRRRATST
jgi:hypothetical protein